MVNMRKRILIMTHKLPIGGIESALLAMLNAIDTKKYQVDLLLLSKEGERLGDVPDKINIYEVSERERIFLEEAGYAKHLIRQKKYVFSCCLRLSISFFMRVVLRMERYDVWVLNRYFVRTFRGRYEAAIDYSGFLAPYITTKVNADKRIIWNHFDYDYYSNRKTVDEKYFEKADKLVSVSEEGAEKLKKHFPQFADRVYVMRDIIDFNRIDILAEEPVNDLPGSGCLKICTVARLQDQKDISLSIRAADVLRDKGIDFVWYVVGEGPHRAKYESEIAKRGLGRHFFLLGKRSNPYPYIKSCDIYCQNSAFEGLGIAVIEAMYLGKPVIVTDVLGLREVVQDGVTGYVVERNEAALVSAIIAFDDDKRRLFAERLDRKDLVNKNNMEVFYSLIDDEG